MLLENKLNRHNVKDIMALTPMQEGMIYQYFRDPNTDQYFQQFSFNLSGRIQSVFFKKAWSYVIESNEILKTVFAWKSLPKPVQIVLKQSPLLF